MELKLRNILKTERGRRVVGRMSIDRVWKKAQDFMSAPSRYEQVEHLTEARLFFRQIGSTEPSAASYLHDRATKAIMREVYGEVLEQLLDIREALYEEGATPADASLTKVQELIDAITG